MDKAEIETLERKFWDALVSKDTDTAASLIARNALVAGPSGPMRIDPDKYAAMLKDGGWTLDSYEFSDIEFVSPADDIAIIAYRARQIGSLKGELMDLKCADSSTWVRQDGEWKCVLHTEAVLGHMPMTN